MKGGGEVRGDSRAITVLTFHADIFGEIPLTTKCANEAMLEDRVLHDDMRATQPATGEVRRMAAEQMMLELTLKKESTARGHLSVETMQSHFINERLKGGARSPSRWTSRRCWRRCSSGWRGRGAGRNSTASS